MVGMFFSERAGIQPTDDAMTTMIRSKSAARTANSNDRAPDGDDDADADIGDYDDPLGGDTVRRPITSRGRPPTSAGTSAVSGTGVQLRRPESRMDRPFDEFAGDVIDDELLPL